MTIPSVSILVPTYNRTRFLDIFLTNIVNFDYDKNKLELCILDDGEEPFIPCNLLQNIIDLISPCSLNYKLTNNNIHMKIGMFFIVFSKYFKILKRNDIFE